MPKTQLSKKELEDKHFHSFLIWCTSPPSGPNSELVFWLDHRWPTEENFWEWLVICNKELLR